MTLRIPITDDLRKYLKDYSVVCPGLADAVITSIGKQKFKDSKHFISVTIKSSSQPFDLSRILNSIAWFISTHLCITQPQSLASISFQESDEEEILVIIDSMDDFLNHMEAKLNDEVLES